MPDGTRVQYNSAHYVNRSSGFSDLLTAKEASGGTWVAQVPNTALIEFVTPCRVYRQDDNASEAQNKMRSLRLEISSLKRKLRQKKAKS